MIRTFLAFRGRAHGAPAGLALLVALMLSAFTPLPGQDSALLPESAPPAAQAEAPPSAPESAAPRAEGGRESVGQQIEETAREWRDKYPSLAWVYAIFFEWGLNVQGEKINLSKLLLALLLIFIGARIARRISELMERKVFARFGLQLDFRHFLERLLRIFILIIFTFVALDVAGIPIGVFAFLGGAIAIAVGFGGQELLANFIGGLILMFEKPIRVGDLIEYDGDRGKVEEIGPRCTRLKLAGNVDMLVPNRKLLENKLINWTLTDWQLRCDVAVGVAYGSPTEKVREILDEVTRAHPEVDNDPVPVVLFESFGDNSLEFRVFCWATVRTFLDQRRIQSELRFEIDKRFREAGITIAFPQRDVHLDTLSPLEVRLLEPRLERRSGAIGGRETEGS